MNRIGKKHTAFGIFLVISLCATSLALANGGPFVVKYPEGDPAAKGVLARLDENLKPAVEERLRVVKEDLKIAFVKAPFRADDGEPPLVRVSAAYTIENPTDKEIEVDFGFPILRGIYMNPLAMMPRPDVQVLMNNKHVPTTIISNSLIYGIIRQKAREVIDKATADDKKLATLIKAVKETENTRYEAARKALAAYLTDKMKWNERDAALMVEYASLDFGEMKGWPMDGAGHWLSHGERELLTSNLGPLVAIGEQKATQFFAQLASRFDPKAAAAYEAIFTAWGGDVRERSVDLKTGKVRPREVTVDSEAMKKLPHHTASSDPTIYARVDYLDPNAKITPAEKESCRTVLKNLPVVFTFAPMNLLHYCVKFPAKATQTLTVEYSQYAYTDTREPATYQLAYVVHPASMWKSFGPINLEVEVPEGVPFRASVPCANGGTVEREVESKKKVTYAVHRATLKEKTGELFLAIDSEAWKSADAQERLQEAVQKVTSK